MKPWYVITGAPSSGKSTTIEQLRALDHRTVPEAARTYFDNGLAKGLTPQDLRGDEADFQRQVLRLKLQIESELPTTETVFLDRGLPDTTAYWRLHGFPEETELELAVQRANYHKVFLLDPLPYHVDYLRNESLAQVRRLDRLLEQVYRELGFKVHRIPPLEPGLRVELILALL